MADHASRDFATGGAGGVAAAVEQLYQSGKDTSLAATIQVPELFRQAQLITSRTLEVFTMYLAALAHLLDHGDSIIDVAEPF